MINLIWMSTVLRFRRHVLMVMFVLFANQLCFTTTARAADWESDWSEIKQIYYRQAKQPDAINQLHRQIRLSGNGYSKSVFREMLVMLTDYFEKVDEPQLLENILFNMSEGSRSDDVLNAFRGSKLFSIAQRANERLSKPYRVDVKTDATRIEIGQSIGFSITVFNEKSRQIELPDVRLRLAPEGMAFLDRANRTITAQASGEVTLEVVDRGGRALGQQKLTIAEKKQPNSAVITLSASEVEVGAPVDFVIKLYDENNNEIESTDVILTLTPDGIATLDRTSRTISGRKPGSVSLIVETGSGQELGRADIGIVEGLRVEIAPKYKEIRIGRSESFLIESNRPLHKLGLDWRVESGDLADAVEVPVDAFSKRIDITAKKVGVTYLRVNNPQQKRLAQATIDIRPAPKPPPSLVYPAIGTAAAAAAGVFAVILNSDASSKLDEWNACRQSTGTPCDDLGKDYDDRINQARILGIVAGGAALGVGYLWYRYLQDRGRYKTETSVGAQQKAYDIGLAPAGVNITIRF